MNDIWFTSDTHFGHANIMRYCPERQGNTVDEMDEILIKNWNEVVKPGDRVFHLGDFTFYKSESKVAALFERLNGQVFLVQGNHDWWLKKFKDNRPVNLVKVRDYYELSVEDPDLDRKRKIVLMHFPILSWHNQHHGAWHLHGHCHGSLPNSVGREGVGKILDVGVDAVEKMVGKHRPISYAEVKEIMEGRPVAVAGDHHVVGSM